MRRDWRAPKATQGKLSSRAFTLVVNACQSVSLNLRTAPAGFLESRTAITVGVLSGGFVGQPGDESPRLVRAERPGAQVIKELCVGVDVG
jgi:hypothetical protein